MQECWYESAAARLTAIRVKKNADILQAKHRKRIQLTKINEANSTANEAITSSSNGFAKKTNTNGTRNVNFAATNNASSHKKKYNNKTPEKPNCEDPSTTPLLLPQNNQNQKSEGTKPIRI